METIEFSYAPLPLQILDVKKRILNVFGFKSYYDRLSEDLDTLDSFRDDSEDIREKLFKLLELYVNTPKNKNLKPMAKEIQELIDENVEDITEFMIHHHKKSIKKLIRNGRWRLASMGQIEKELQNVPKTENLLKENDYINKIKLIEETFNEIYKLKNDSELIVKDNTIPAALKYIGALAVIIMAVITLYNQI